MNRFDTTLEILKKERHRIRRHGIRRHEAKDIEDAIRTLETVRDACGESDYDKSIRLVATFEDGTQRMITQHELDLDNVVYSKYGLSIKKLEILGSKNDVL